jgi:hypothetical protein
MGSPSSTVPGRAAAGLDRDLNTSKTSVAGALVVLIAAVVTLAAGAQGALAARSCPSGEVLIPFSSTSAGSKTAGTCIRSARGPHGQTRVDAAYGEVARAVIRRYAAIQGVEARHATVVCWSQRDWSALDRKNRSALAGDWSPGNAGFVILGSTVINLAPSMCRELDRITYEHGKPTLASSTFPVSTLVHEALHAAGVRGEAEVECLAMQLAAGATSGLGQDRRFGRELARHAFRGYAAYGRQHPAYYTPLCRNGTALDLHPGTLRFP